MRQRYDGDAGALDDGDDMGGLPARPVIPIL